MSSTTEPSPVKRARVFLVDDHPLVREGLLGVIEPEADLEVCGQAENAKQAQSEVLRLQPDVIVVDLSLGEDSGIELIKQLRELAPAMRILVLSMHDEVFYAERALRAGAHGYVTKRESSSSFVEGIRAVLAGRRYLSGQLATQLAARLLGGGAIGGASAVEQLTNRELQVFQLIGDGLTTQNIARQLGLSMKTIQAHADNIKSKMGLRNSIELLREAVRWTEGKKGL